MSNYTAYDVLGQGPGHHGKIGHWSRNNVSKQGDLVSCHKEGRLIAGS